MHCLTTGNQTEHFAGLKLWGYQSQYSATAEVDGLSVGEHSQAAKKTIQISANPTKAPGRRQSLFKLRNEKLALS